MHKQIFVNLPVKDLKKSMAFFKALGYEFNPDFTNDSGACMVMGDNLFAMLLTEPFFKGFTPKAIADAKTSTEVLVCVSCDSKQQVDSLVAKAVSAGGTAPNKPQEHEGFMYGHGFQDLDGHLWELVYMVPGATPPKQ